MTGDVIEPRWAAPARVKAWTTTRQGGASLGPWRSLNLGDACGDDAQAVAENRRRLAEWLPAGPLWLRQVHGARVIEHPGSVAERPEADAVVSSRPGEVCAVLTADCLPVLFADPDGEQVAAAHAGWRGLAAGVLESTVRAMSAAPDRLAAWLGPAICQDHYEVGSEVRAAFVGQDADAAAAFLPHRDRWLASLEMLARLKLKRAGVTQVSSAGLCTACHPQRFFSHRRDGVAGRMATVIWIQE
ncbi:MAG TPA: peptidoglycan editing factor PgeF [Xanthomonadales bacterium]|nr:peptidoglycan editing factor PgeF [Xanthomonadales bacterium]